LQQEIAERKQLEEALQASKLHLKTAQHIACIGSWSLDLISGKLIWSDEIFRIFEIDPNQFSATYEAFLDAIYPEDRDAVDRAYTESLTNHTPYEIIHRLIMPDGRVKWVQERCTSEFDEAGKAKRSTGTVQDITERKMADESLLLARFSINRSSDGFFWMTPDARIVDVNDAACRSLGYSKEELLQLTIPDIDPFYNANVWQQHFIDLRQQGSLKFETVHTTKDGIQFPVEIAANYIKFGSEEYNCGIVRNITERKQAEEDKLALDRRFQESQKLESLGVLAGGIAHDFNNILCVIISSCSLAQLRPDMSGKLLTEIDNAAQRAAELCRQMLAYAGKSLITMKRINMTELVTDLINMLKVTIKQNVAITSDLSGNLPSTLGDASQLRQVVMNLIINASEAFDEEQGEIHVTLTMIEIEAGQSIKDYFGTDIVPGCYACLEVSDTGCGMDDDVMQRIFEPFYTTKFTGRGLGMSAVIGIITSHKGSLQLFSQVGKGTTFKVYLPALGCDSAGDKSQQQVVPAPWKGSGTILLVDDEVQIMAVAKALLETMGFSVIEALNGNEAIEQYQKYAAEISMVLTDIGMPVMDGYELFRELKKINPKLPIIVSSGFAESDILSHIARADIAGLVSKPYRYDQMREVLKEVSGGCRVESK
jgi:PAS domain S-box-containing protein